MKIERLTMPINAPRNALAIDPIAYFAIGDAKFNDLLSAGTFAIVHNIPLELNEEKAGLDLGTMLVAVNEGRLDASLIARALVDSTDPAYKEGAQKLITALQRFVDLA